MRAVIATMSVSDDAKNEENNFRRFYISSVFTRQVD